MTTEEKIWDYLTAAGLTPCGAAGLMGNLYAESGLNPQNLQNACEKKLGYTDATYTAAVDSGSYTNFVHDGAGYGLAQWTYWSRKQALWEHAKSKGKSVGDLEMQLGFLLKELAGSFAGVLAVLKSAGTVKEASDAVLLQFEKPASMNSEATQARRAGFGQSFYDKYAAKEEVCKVKIIESILTNNPCYKKGKKITVKGLMLHSVGCPQPSAQVFVKNWNKSSYDRACVHGFIDANTGDVYQTLPWNYRGWHCGSGKNGSGNNTHIGVEMCEPGCIKYTGGSTFTCSDMAKAKAAVKRTYDSAVELFAMLCKQYKLDPLKDGVIVSHKEGHARGIATNHGDPEHLWTQLKTGYTMDGFRRAVKAAMEGTAAPAEPAAATANGAAYRVRVTASTLNIRTKPGTNYGIAGCIKDRGVYTIVEESNGWGKLKSGAGWISLSYCEKV